MIRECTTKDAIEYGLDVLKRRPYIKELYDEVVSVIEKNGYESIESIDAFLKYLSKETDIRGFWGPDMIYYYLMISPKCRERLMNNIYSYSALINSFVCFLREFNLKEDLDYVSKIIIEKRKEYPRSFSMYVSANWEDAARRYCELLDAFPNASTLEKVERDCKEKYNYPVGAALLSECMKLIEGCETLTKAEIDFWNENLKLMKEWLTKREYEAFLGKRYMLLFKNIKILSREVQEEVLKRFGQRSISRFVTKGNTEEIAYLIIGKVLRQGDMKDFHNLKYKPEYQKKFTDWKGLVKIFKVAYEEVDPSNYKLKKRFEWLLDSSEEMLENEEELDSDDILAILIQKFN